MLSESEIVSFRQDLLSWFGRAQRDLPWRHTRDPYAIWVSEAMLQQTRVAAALPFYRNFVRQFPDFRALAQASESDLLSAWAGLGYYYRARNLQKAAQMMCADGAFPDSYVELRGLPGIGDYTAAAVASIAFGLPHAVLDGNVFRVLARLLGDGTDISSSDGRKHFSMLAATVLDHGLPGAFNQAMMELGATVCLPRNPQCLVCPVSHYCRAKGKGTQQELPVNASKQKPVREDRVLFWIEQGTSLLAWKRSKESRLMPGFWELPETAQVGDAAIRLRNCRLISPLNHVP